MDYQTITSRDNPLVKQYVQLATSRKHRTREGKFVIEGAKLLFEALDAGYTLHMLFCTQTQAQTFQMQFEALGISPEKIRMIGPSVMDKLAQSPSPQGVFAIFDMLDNAIRHVKIKAGGKYILLDGLQDPGNIGTIVRTAAAFGMDGLVLSSNCPDLYSLKMLRAAMGGIFRVPIEITEDMAAYIYQISKAGMTVYAAVLNEKAVSVQDICMQEGCAVVIGNEGNGVSSIVAERCAPVMIPIEAVSESLNAAIAASILMWEMVR